MLLFVNKGKRIDQLPTGILRLTPYKLRQNSFNATAPLFSASF